MAEMFSAKWVMFFSVAINVICTLLTPVMAGWHYAALILMRIGEGIGGGVTFPAMHVLLAHWAPPTERSVMSSIVYAGTALGTVVSNSRNEQGMELSLDILSTYFSCGEDYSEIKIAGVKCLNM